MYKKHKEAASGGNLPETESGITMRTIDNYQFSTADKLGRGTFGIVYKGIDKRNSQSVALKECNPNDPNEMALVEREIRTMQVIPDHPNIIKFRDSLLEGPNIFWIITELCDLGHLGTYMKRFKPDIEEKLLIMKQCVEGVNYLHHLKEPVIHRDLKPENILFKTTSGSNATVKIADFGLAKVLANSTKLKTIAGTHLYMAPELVLEAPNHCKAVDIFSLGLVFLAILLFEAAGDLIPVSGWCFLYGIFNNFIYINDNN